MHQTPWLPFRHAKGLSDDRDLHSTCNERFHGDSLEPQVASSSDDICAYASGVPHAASHLCRKNHTPERRTTSVQMEVHQSLLHLHRKKYPWLHNRGSYPNRDMQKCLQQKRCLVSAYFQRLKTSRCIKMLKISKSSAT